MKTPRRAIEREFGVPFAGEIVPEAQWTRTALRELPQPLDWTALFGRAAPVVLDLGCGNGRFLIGSAVWRPDHDHLGVDALPLVIRYAARRANQRGLANLRFAVADAGRTLGQLTPPQSVAEIHVYHPQPYYDPRDDHRRLLRPAFLASAYRALAPQGRLFLQTDHGEYWRYLLTVVPRFFDWSPRDGAWPDAPKGRTRREILALRRGLPVYRGSGALRPGLTETDLARLAAELPSPTFAADPNLRELDALEDEPGPFG
jgi:tRNA (guanine-N7-)-methyltransferase